MIKALNTTNNSVAKSTCFCLHLSQSMCNKINNKRLHSNNDIAELLAPYFHIIF